MKTIYSTLVISGGGSKGLVHLGILEFVWQLGYLEKIKDIWGVSVGSIISLFLCLNYTPQEIFQIFFRQGILRLGDVTSSIQNFIGLMNIESLGNRLLEILNYKINRTTTFKEFSKLTDKQLNIIGCCKDNYDAQSIFNLEITPTMSVIDAIEISCALPFIFTEKIYNSKRFIDGCFANDLPVDLAYNSFKKKNEEFTKILAIWVKSDGNTDYSFLNDIYKLLTISMHQMQLLRNSIVPKNKLDLIEVASSGLGFADLSPDRKKQVEMWGEGFRAAEDYYSKKFNDGWEI